MMVNDFHNIVDKEATSIIEGMSSPKGASKSTVTLPGEVEADAPSDEGGSETDWRCTIGDIFRRHLSEFRDELRQDMKALFASLDDEADSLRRQKLLCGEKRSTVESSDANVPRDAPEPTPCFHAIVRPRRSLMSAASRHTSTDFDGVAPTKATSMHNIESARRATSTLSQTVSGLMGQKQKVRLDDVRQRVQQEEQAKLAGDVKSPRSPCSSATTDQQEGRRQSTASHRSVGKTSLAPQIPLQGKRLSTTSCRSAKSNQNSTLSFQGKQPSIASDGSRKKKMSKGLEGLKTRPTTSAQPWLVAPVPTGERQRGISVSTDANQDPESVDTISLMLASTTRKVCALRHDRDVAKAKEAKKAAHGPRRRCFDRIGNVLSPVVESPFFDAFSSAAVVSNAIIIGFQADYEVRHYTSDVPRGYRIAEITFCCIFSFELLLRLCAYGTDFLSKSGLLWGMFDVVIVGLQLLEEIMHLIATKALGNMGFMRMLRILRLLRIVRVVRIIRFMGELRNLVMSIMNSLRSLMWTVVLVVLFIYGVGVYFTQLVADYRISYAEDVLTSEVPLTEDEELVNRFGGLSSSMLSLYQAMSNGVDWDDLFVPLVRSISPFQGFVLVVYIAFTVLALTNVVTGVFVEAAISGAREEENKFFTQQLHDLFEMLDTEETGRISREQFRIAMETPEVHGILDGLEVDLSDAKCLFHLVDADHSGEIDYLEFIAGCMRMRSQAKSMEIMMLSDSLRNVRTKVDMVLSAVATMTAVLQETDACDQTSSSSKSERVAAAGAESAHHSSFESEDSESKTE